MLNLSRILYKEQFIYKYFFLASWTKYLRSSSIGWLSTLEMKNVWSYMHRNHILDGEKVSSYSPGRWHYDRLILLVLIKSGNCVRLKGTLSMNIFRKVMIYSFIYLKDISWK